MAKMRRVPGRRGAAAGGPLGGYGRRVAPGPVTYGEDAAVAGAQACVDGGTLGGILNAGLLQPEPINISAPPCCDKEVRTRDLCVFTVDLRRNRDAVSPPGDADDLGTLVNRDALR